MTDDTRSRRRRLARALILVLALVASGGGMSSVQAQAPEAPAKAEPKASQGSVEPTASQRSAETTPSIEDLKPKLGQFFIFGLPGPDLSEATRKHILDTRATAFILFRRNLNSNKQVTELTRGLHKLSEEITGQPALIGLDQEGGRVIRIPFDPPLPSAYAMGQTRDPALIEGISFQVGRALRQLGFNVNFAPVLDLGTDTKYSFLGQRAFSDDPVWASDFGAAFARGHVRARVLPVAKHFPGIGPIPNDPHLSLVRRPVSMEELRTRDLVPFENFTRISESGIMISHLIYPKIDPVLPGTFSKAIVEDLLQTQLNYKGLVVTDDLMMEGAKASKHFEDDIVKAFEAGADLLMITWSGARQKQGVNALWKALQNGRIKPETVVARLAKMERIRANVKMDRTPFALDDRRLLVYNFKPYEKVIDQALNKTLSEAGRALMFPPSARMLVLRDQAKVLESLATRTPQSESIPSINQGSLKQILAQLQKSPTSTDVTSNDVDTWVYFIRSRAEAEIAASIPLKVRNQVLLVNLWRPDAKVGAFPNQVGLFMSHPKANQLLAAWINERVLQSRVRPSDDPSRFGQLPSRHLRAFPSSDVSRAVSIDPGPLSR